jgi:hypothetical protein
VARLSALALVAMLGCGAPAPASPGEPAPTGGGDTSHGSIPRCTGDLDVAGAIATIRALDPLMRDCYETELRTEPNWSVTIHVAIAVLPSGDVDTISFEPVGHPTFEACVPAALARATFSPVTGGECAVVLVPYTFTPAAS